MRKLYDWMMRAASDKRAPYALGTVSFVESSFFPIPPDVMLIPMILRARRKAWGHATIAPAPSLPGGLRGSAIRYFAFEAVGKPIPAFYGKEHGLDSFIQFV